VGAPRETHAALLSYLDLLAAWGRRVNLSAARTRAERIAILIQPALALLPLLLPGALLDVGSGNGTPGLVLALLEPQRAVTLLEPRARRWAFLREAARACGRADIDVRREHMDDRRPPEVRVTEIEEGKILEAGGVTVSAFLVDHGPVKPAFGFRFDGGGRSVVVSGDTRPSENLVRWSQDVDCLIHECCDMARTGWFPGCGWPTLEEKIRDLQSYHTPPGEVGRVATDARAKTLVLSHLMPASEPAELLAAARTRYAGPVVVGADLLEV